MQCDRCQGYFRNFTQLVRKGAETYCVQCDTAIKAGAATRMYAETLPSNSIFEAPEFQTDEGIAAPELG
ncbi:hypothetical protein [Achromobacter spanius]|uniref:hypothetical protein n=1 Tax=Achromobacter spanius TaxID=217203 RepID=UPI0037FA5D44